MAVEPISLSIGIVALFEPCLFLYRRVSDARNYPADCENLALLFEIEKRRFKLCRSDLQADRTRLFDLCMRDLNLNIDSDLESSSSYQDVIKRVLAKVQHSLAEADQILRKYEPKHPETGFKLRRSVTWAVAEKGTLEQIVERLSKLNAGLERFVDRSSSSRQEAMIAAILLRADTKKLDAIRGSPAPGGYTFLQTAAKLRAAVTGVDQHERLRDFEIVGPQFSMRRKGNNSPFTIAYLSDPSLPPRSVLIETRTAFTTTLSAPEVAQRLNHLVQSLQLMDSFDNGPASPSESHFGVLKCVGWVKARYPDLDSIELVFDHPPNSTQSPQSLHWYLSRGSKRPSLSLRLNLGLRLARLYSKFMSVEYLHRAINSENILFFNEDMKTPYLAGVSEARPQAVQMHSTKLASSNEWDLYVPWRESNEIEARKWSAAMDLYGLGVVLLELGYWRSARQIRGDSGTREFHDNLGKLVDQLAFYVGDIYRDVVKRCLDLKRNTVDATELCMAFDSGVLQQLEKCCI